MLLVEVFHFPEKAYRHVRTPNLAKILVLRYFKKESLVHAEESLAQTPMLLFVMRRQQGLGIPLGQSVVEVTTVIELSDGCREYRGI